MRTLILFGLIIISAAAQDDGWKTEVDNQLVHVSRRIVEPHGTVSTAGMPPALLVFLSDFSVRIASAGRQAELQGKPGQLFWYSGGQAGIENLNRSRLEMVQVTPRYSLEPSYKLPAVNPANVKFENDLIRVRHIRPVPGQRKEARKSPAVVVFLSPAHIRVTYANGRVEEGRFNRGGVRFDAGGSFVFENLGDEHEVLRIELKTGAPIRGVRRYL